MRIAATTSNNKNELLNSKIEKRRMEMNKFQKYDPSHFRSRSYNRMRMNDQMAHTLKREEEENKRKLISKRQEYGNMMYEMHPPVVSLKKREEMK